MNDLAKKKEALLEAKARRESARAEKLEAIEVLVLELEEKFSEELGDRGVHFEIVDLSDLLEEPIVLKLGEPVSWKKFTASKMGEGDVFDFVSPSVVYPKPDKFTAIVGARPHIGIRCAEALSLLFGVKNKEQAGKA